jgi:PKD repeat protein
MFSNGRTRDGNRGPRIDFEMPGVYTATLQVTTELGTSTVTKHIEIPREPGLSPEVRQSGGRVAP